MARPIDQLTTEQINNILRNAGYTWKELEDYCASFAKPALSQPAPAPKSDVDAAWVKATAEAILKSGCKMSPNAQTFVGQTFARASQYPTVRFSPKQWEWYNKLMLDAGVEALELNRELPS